MKPRALFFTCLYAAAAIAIGACGSAFGQTIPISGADSGRTFDGIGAVSGGGATSVLLKD